MDETQMKSSSPADTPTLHRVNPDDDPIEEEASLITDQANGQAFLSNANNKERSRVLELKQPDECQQGGYEDVVRDVDLSSFKTLSESQQSLPVVSSLALDCNGSDDDASLDTRSSSDSECDKASLSPGEPTNADQKQFFSALESIYKTTNLSDRAMQAIPTSITRESLTYLYSRTQEYSTSSKIIMDSRDFDSESSFKIKIKG